MRTLFPALLLGAGLVAASPAIAEDPHHGSDHAADTTAHGHDGAPGSHGAPHAEDAHGGDHAGDAHGDHHGHHDPTEFYLGDNDHDGVPNWRDPSENGEPRDLLALLTDGEDAYFVPEIAFHAFNLLIVIVLLWRFAARPIGDALKNRALAIRKQLTEAARARDEARQRNEELSARLTRFEKELQEMRSTAAAEAEAEAKLLIERARAEAERIQQTAERNIAEEVRRARADLKAEAVDLAVQLATTTLAREVKADDQRRLAREFLDSLKNDGDSAHG